VSADGPNRYDPNPRYPAVGGRVRIGWDAGIEGLPRTRTVLAVDGAPTLDWTRIVDDLQEASRASGRLTVSVDVRRCYAPWPTILERTDAAELAGDPDFARLATATIDVLFEARPALPADADVDLLLLFGPGSALFEPDVLWYLEQPKRYAEAAVVAGIGMHLGQADAANPPTTRRLFYIDWPILERHRADMADRVDRWWDLQDPVRPTSLSAHAMARTLSALVHRPFRTRPTFNTTSWGGHWAQRELGMNPGAPNTALGYELVAPESGVLVGDDETHQVEVPFQLLVDRHPRMLLGDAVYEAFGTSFPIRFDYLDTVSGGGLSVHCHPRPAYMSEVFGWSYPQHESYYVMVGGTDSVIYLGVRGDLDVDEFRRHSEAAQQSGASFDISRHVQTFPATSHQLFLIPAGTPHGSGIGNVVLEVSATPYLYSLRFYDWLRRDAAERRRPVHVAHAFCNLDRSRQGSRVSADLVPVPRTARSGPGWREEVLGDLPEMFFDVRRVALDAGAEVREDTAGRFHVLNVVDGDGVIIDTGDGSSVAVAYAETIVVPAAVGVYTMRVAGAGSARVVKAYVR
jgi:mannose-6-phosphate isomerase class I